MKLILLAAALFYVSISSAQQQVQKIKIILLGTFHFNQAMDSASRLHADIFSEKRQKEVDDIVKKLVKQKPDKIFLEFTKQNQPYYDSVYNDYLTGKEPEKISTKANEIFQLGMKTAKKRGLKHVIGMNDQPADFADSKYKPVNTVDTAMQNLYKVLDKFEDTTRSNAAFYDLPYPYRFPKQDSLLQKSTLARFLLQLNTPQRWQYEDYTNWNYLYSVGKNNMSATDYVATFWYGVNVRNYNNVLRNVDIKNDSCYLIIYGNSHISILKHLFESNPFFEVMDIKNILQ